MPDISVTVEALNIDVGIAVTGPQGPAGAAGEGVPTGGTLGQVLTKISATDYDTEWSSPGAASNYETYPAGQNLSAGRVVIIEGGEAIYFNPANALHHNRAFGITKTSASVGNDVTIQPAYTVATDAGFTFSADIALWVGPNGEVVDAIDSGWVIVQKAGVSLENDKLLIDFSTSIKKN